MTPPIAPDAPSAAALLRSTAVAVTVAAVLLVTCVLPAEYAIDPTGVGRVLGLTQMGEVKMALAEEAAANAAAEASADSVIAAAEAAAAGAAAPTATAPAVLRVDTTRVVLAPGKGGEIKLVMPAGTRAGYVWRVANGVVNYDMHGDSTNAPKDWFVSYRKGRGAVADSGKLSASFTGNHGWYWRNRGARAVDIQLITTGTYERIDRHP